MKSRRIFNVRDTLEAARDGRLTPPDLRRAIAICEEFGNKPAADELRLHVVSSNSFANDGAPPEVRNRVAQAISALVGMGRNPNETRGLLKKHGVIATINRIANDAQPSPNFEVLRSAGLERLTAEAIVLDAPDLFSEEAVKVARARLNR